MSLTETKKQLTGEHTMANKNFAVQQTSQPFGPTETPYGWETYSEHATLSAAQKAKAKLETEMHKRCGQGAWDSHQRIIALKTQTMTETQYCHGDNIGGWTFCPDSASHQETFTWQADEPMPYHPTGWQCAKCAARTEAYEAEMDA